MKTKTPSFKTKKTWIAPLAQRLRHLNGLTKSRCAPHIYTCSYTEADLI